MKEYLQYQNTKCFFSSIANTKILNMYFKILDGKYQVTIISVLKTQLIGSTWDISYTNKYSQHLQYSCKYHHFSQYYSLTL